MQVRASFCGIFETAHNLVASFRLFGDYMSPENILRERYIIWASWKWLGEKKVHAVSVLDDPERYAENPYDDYHVLSTLHKVLSEADFIVAHNGDKFDWKFFQGRLLIQGFAPLPPIVSIDTLKVAKRNFLFNANRLDYLGKILKVGRKIETTSGLWLKVLQGDTDAIKKVVKYNKGDVQLLERVFLKLRPYIKKIPTFMPGLVCPKPGCHSARVQHRGKAITSTRTYQRYQCQDCGGWFQGVKADKPEADQPAIEVKC